MATSNPLDDILNSNVDQNELNAVYGNLESQLHSPTFRAQVNSSFSNSGIVNNTGTFTLAGQVPNSSAVSVPNNVYSVGNNQINTTNLNGGQNMIGNVPINHINAAGSTVNSQRIVKTEISQHNPVLNNSQIHQMQALGHIKNDSIQGHHVVTQRINQPMASGNSQMTGTGAILNLANVASEQKPIVISNTGEVKPHFTSSHDSRQPVVVNVVNPNNVHRPPFVLKQETKPMVPQVKSEVKPQIMQQGQIRVMTTPNQQMSNTLNVINSQQNVLRTPFTTSSTSVVMTRPATNPQTVTVVRPAISASQLSSPNVMGSPRIATQQINRAVLPRASGAPPIRIAPQNQPVVRSQGGAISLPPGVQLPPGAVLMKNAEGHLVVVQQSAQKMQQVRPGISSAAGAPRPVPNAVQPSAAVRQNLQQTLPVHPQQPVAQPQAAAPTQTPQQQQETRETVIESMKKCKNFLQTLIKLASQSHQSANTVENVKRLIQCLIDAKIEPEVFTERLQAILNSSPQPYLVPFLRKSLPMLRLYLIQNKIRIDGVRAPPAEVMQRHPVPGIRSQPVSTPVQSSPSAPITNRTPIPPNIKKMTHEQLQQFVTQTKLLQQQAQQQQQRPPAQTKALLTKQTGSSPASAGGSSTAGRTSTPNHHRVSTPASSHLQAAASSSSSKVSTTPKRKFDSSTIKDDDDINDVATMGGVNLSEESRNIMASTELLSGQMRSCKDESFLLSKALTARINTIARKRGLDDCSPEVINLVSHATQERIKNLLERLSVIAEHRLEIYKNDSRFERSSEPRTQLKFLEELEQLEKKRHSEAEREVLLRAAKSRSKNEDPEHLKLREKAKQMQQQELEDARQREANLTALAAIGPRKKRKIEENSATDSLGSSNSRLNIGTTRQRIKRVNLRDLVFLLEQERESNKSTVLYKACLK